MSEPITVGWQVTDPHGNVVQAGEVTVVEADILEEIATFIAASATTTHPEGEPTWPA